MNIVFENKAAGRPRICETIFEQGPTGGQATSAKADLRLASQVYKLWCNFALMANVSDQAMRSLKICSFPGGSQAG
jgi:hypothetical protein